MRRGDCRHIQDPSFDGGSDVLRCSTKHKITVVENDCKKLFWLHVNAPTAQEKTVDRNHFGQFSALEASRLTGQSPEDPPDHHPSLTAGHLVWRRKSVTTVTNLPNASCPEPVVRLFLLDHTDLHAIRWYYLHGVIVVTTLPVGFRSDGFPGIHAGKPVL